MSIDYRYLKAFTYTAEFLNFSKAAEHLKIAQSAVSRQIKLLEESLDEQLILRSSKKVILTEKGQELYSAAQMFEKQLSTIFEKQQQKIRVGILHGLLEHWFIKVTKELQKRFNYTLQIEVNGPEELIQKMEAGQFDVTVTTTNIQSEIVSSLKIFEERPVLISKSPINSKEIQKATWVVYDKNDYLFKNYKVHSKDIMQVNSITSMVKMVKEGIGIAIVPQHVISSSDRLTVQTLKGLNKENIYLNLPNLKKQPKYINDIKSVIEKVS